MPCSQLRSCRLPGHPRYCGCHCAFRSPQALLVFSNLWWRQPRLAPFLPWGFLRSVLAPCVCLATVMFSHVCFRVHTASYSLVCSHSHTYSHPYLYLCAHLLVSWDSRDRCPQTRWLKTTKICSFTALEARSRESGCQSHWRAPCSFQSLVALGVSQPQPPLPTLHGLLSVPPLWFSE